MDMRSNSTLHDAEHSQTNKHGSSRPVDVSRRKFLAASAVGIAGLGAVGSVGSAAAASEEHTLVIDGSGSTTSYQFTVGGNLEKSTADGATKNSGDEIVGRSAHGAVADGKDAYTFTGPLYSFDFDESNGLDVDLDGEAAHVGQRPDHTLVVEGTGPKASYSFSTSERAEQSDAYGASINEGEKINDYGVAGAVKGGKDAFTYDGELLSFYFDEEDDEIRVTIDGKAAHVGQRPDHTLTVVARNGYSEYEVEIDGSIREVLDAESGQDSRNGNTFSGAVSGTGVDKFTYDGVIESFSYSNLDALDAYTNYRQFD